MKPFLSIEDEAAQPRAKADWSMLVGSRLPLKLGAAQNQQDLETVLLDACRSGQFYPCSRWVVPSQGLGINKKRCLDVWKCMVAPADVTSE